MKNWLIAVLAPFAGAILVWALLNSHPGSGPSGGEPQPAGPTATVPTPATAIAAPLDPDGIRQQVQAGAAILGQRISDLEERATAVEIAVGELGEAEGEDAAPSDAHPELMPEGEPLATTAALALPFDSPGSGFAPIPEFDAPLEPYGAWFDTADYGAVWQPDVAAGGDWAPYVDGGWEWTDLGWYWETDEPWGWATYHYGRWVQLEDPGWCWVPGSDWAPAWVSWRACDTHIGWAPLPPSCRWDAGVGIGSWVDARCDIGPGHYCFVPVRHFGRRDCSPHRIPHAQNAELLLHCRNVTRLCPVRAQHPRLCIANYGPDPDRLAPHVGRRFEQRRIQTSDAPSPPTTASKSPRSAAGIPVAALVKPFARPKPSPATRGHRAGDQPRRAGWSVLAGDPAGEIAVRRHLLAELDEEDEAAKASPRPARPFDAPRPASALGRRPAAPDATPKLISAREREAVALDAIRARKEAAAVTALAARRAEQASRELAERQRLEREQEAERADAFRQAQIVAAEKRAAWERDRLAREKGAREAASERARQAQIAAAADARRLAAQQEAADAELAERQAKALAMHREEDQRRAQEDTRRRQAEAEENRQRQLLATRRAAEEKQQRDAADRRRAEEERRRVEERRRTEERERQSQLLAMRRAEEQRKSQQEEARRRAHAEEQRRMAQQRADEQRRRAEADRQRRARAESEARKAAEMRQRAEAEAARQRAAAEAQRRQSKTPSSSPGRRK